MLTGIVIGALSAAALLPQTDTIVQTNGASRLEVESLQGEVVVRVWDRDAVQVTAEQTDGPSIRIARSGSAIAIGPDVEKGQRFSHSMNLEITVPKAFDLSVEGVAINVDVRGTEGRIEVMTAHGTIHVEGGGGSVALQSVNGPIHVEGVHGDLEVTGVAGGVTIQDCVGDVHAESVGGDMTLEGVTSTDVEVGTVGGVLRFEGSIEDGGQYRFGTHGGEIWLYLPDGMNAQIDALTLAGDFEVSYPGAPSEPTRGEGIPGLTQKELSFELGTGSARIEVETFGGTIHILRAGGG